jgi:hypothetical protein
VDISAGIHYPRVTDMGMTLYPLWVMDMGSVWDECHGYKCPVLLSADSLSVAIFNRGRPTTRVVSADKLPHMIIRSIYVLYSLETQICGLEGLIFFKIVPHFVLSKKRVCYN